MFSHRPAERLVALLSWLAAGLVFAACAAEKPRPRAATPSGRPNFVLIVADDLGFSDLGCFGGEIHTPNLDRLAREGVRFTNHYVSVSCSPTRAMLLTGRDNHVVGMGNMHERTAPNQQGRPGYEGIMSADVPTIADALRAHGYHTYMAGKWHLGHDPRHVPAARGFERSFSMLNSAGSHFDKTGYRVESEQSEFNEDGVYLDELPGGYYSSKTYTDKLIANIGANVDDGRPFFAYLAFQAPHDPLQVPDDWLRRYKTRYDAGWADTREQRLQRMKDLGLVAPAARLAEQLWFVPGWDRLTGMAQVVMARKMEIYAAMVEYLDMQVGRLVAALEANGLAENTYIVFLSDNGPESSDFVAQAKERPNSTGANFVAQNYRTDFAAWGRRDSYVAYGEPWAQVSATPFYMFKGAMYEGGIRSPLIVWHAGMAAGGRIDGDSITHVSDVAPTLLDLAGIERSALLGEGQGETQTGRSWRPLLEHGGPTQEFAERGVALEMWGCRAYREGRWKITWMHRPFGIDDWQLYDVVADPGERDDLSRLHPERRQRMIAAWDAYAAANNVILPDRTEYDGLEERLPPRPPVESVGWPPGQEPNWTGREK